jgi:hypothetical protein
MFGNAGSAMNLRVPHPPGFPVRRGGVNDLHAVFLKVVTGVADPQGMKRF